MLLGRTNTIVKQKAVQGESNHGLSALARWVSRSPLLAQRTRPAALVPLIFAGPVHIVM